MTKYLIFLIKKEILRNRKGQKHVENRQDSRHRCKSMGENLVEDRKPEVEG